MENKNGCCDKQLYDFGDHVSWGALPILVSLPKRLRKHFKLKFNSRYAGHLITPRVRFYESKRGKYTFKKRDLYCDGKLVMRDVCRNVFKFLGFNPSVKKRYTCKITRYKRRYPVKSAKSAVK